MGAAFGKGAADIGVLDEHRQLVKSVETQNHDTAPVCDNTDPGHVHGEHCDHEHSHDHKQHGSTTAETRFGITSFVYRKRRPFHPVRLGLFLKSLGKLSVNGINEMKEFPSGSPQSGESNLNSSEYNDAKRSLLRSKGFMWLASSSNAAYFMSHAGQYLEIAPLGRWWAGSSTIILF